MKFKVKTYDTRRFKKLLIHNGYELLRTKGDHYIYGNGKNTVTINRHINRMVAQRLIKENNLVEI